MTAHQEAWLLKAPVEVLVQIASYLPTTSYCAFRQACKYTESATFHAFAVEFFKRRQFMLTEFSLQALIDISKSRLAPSVEYVSLSMDKPRMEQFRSHSFRISRLADHEQALHQNRFHEAYEDHTTLVTTGRDCQLLTQGLKNLPNLQALSLRDFHSRGRYRDGPDARWRPYGSTTFYRETSIPSDCHTSLFRGYHGSLVHVSSPTEEAELQYLKHLLTTIMRAWAAISDSSPVSRLEIILNKLALTDNAFALSKSQRSSILPSFSNLKALYLDLCTLAASNHVETPEHKVRPSYNYHLMDILSYAKDIEHLRVNCKEPQSKLSVDELFGWLSKSPADHPTSISPQQWPDLPQLPTPVDFLQLQTIEIGFAMMESNSLLDLFVKLKQSLKSITLHKITLYATQQQQDDKVNLWAQLLGKIAGLDLALTSIVLDSAKLGHDQYRLSHVKFKDSVNSVRRTWHGTATRYGLKDFIDALEIEWSQIPPMGTGTGTNSDEDEDDEDDDEDEDEEMDEDEDRDEDDADDADDGGQNGVGGQV